VRVEERVDHRHRAGQRELHPPLRRLAQEGGIVDEHPVAPRHRADDHGNVRVVAVADAHGLPVPEIDAVESLDERGDEMAARLLAVGDDVDVRGLLVAQDEAHRVALAFGQRRAFEPPRGPKLLGRGKPCGFRQAAGNRRWQQSAHGGVRGDAGVARPAQAGPDYSGDGRGPRPKSVRPLDQ
jgi:hypothetical protein